MIINSVTHLRSYYQHRNRQYCRKLSADIAVPTADVSVSIADIVATNGECFMMFHNVLCITSGSRFMKFYQWFTMSPRWKINSFLSEISVCWSCTEKITIKIERAFSVILLASPATRSSFQLSPQLPTVTAANLGFNAQLATANARWRFASLSIRCLYVDIKVY